MASASNFPQRIKTAARRIAHCPAVVNPLRFDHTGIRSNFIVETKGMPRDDVYMLLSAAMDLNVTQIVDGTKGIHAILPKAIFQSKAGRACLLGFCCRSVASTSGFARSLSATSANGMVRPSSCRSRA